MEVSGLVFVTLGLTDRENLDLVQSEHKKKMQIFQKNHAPKIPGILIMDREVKTGEG